MGKRYGQEIHQRRNAHSQEKNEEITERITKEIQTNQNISFSRISKDE